MALAAFLFFFFFFGNGWRISEVKQVGGIFWIVSEVEGKDPFPSKKQGSRLINSVAREVRGCA